MTTATIIAIVGLAQTVVGGMIGYGTWTLSSMRSETRERLDKIHVALQAVNGRLQTVEKNEARTDEWRRGYVKMTEKCGDRFDSLNQELKELQARR